MSVGTMAQGWIRLHRKVRDNSLWPKNRRFTPLEAWLDLLLSANHAPAKISFGISKPASIERGQLITSQVQLAKNWRWNRKTVKKFLLDIENEKMLDIESSKGGDIGFTLITIRNYSRYQDKENEHWTLERTLERTSKQGQKGHSMDINKNVKNEKKEEEGHEFQENSPSHAPQPGPNERGGTDVGTNGGDWGRRDWIPFFLHNQNYIPGFPVESFLNPQWWNNLFDQYPKQIGPGTLERTFAFMGRHFIEKPHKKPKTTRGYLQKTANIIRIQLEKDERVNSDRTDMSWLEPQSDFMKKYFSERSQGERS